MHLCEASLSHTKLTSVVQTQVFFFLEELSSACDSSAHICMRLMSRMGLSRVCINAQVI